MKFCSECGVQVVLKTPDGDDRLRYVCDTCNIVHYQNPKIVCGCIPEWEDQVLLCKRAIEPRANYWTLPAGFMELDETTEEGAKRETWEEARAEVEVLGLYCVFNLPHVDQVYMMFRSRLLNLNFEPGPESTHVQLYKEDEIPWQDLAFATIRQTLKYFYADRKSQQFKTHFGDIKRGEGQSSYRPGPELI